MKKVAKNIEFVSVTFVKSGHTYLPSDYVHSAIDSN